MRILLALLLSCGVCLGQADYSTLLLLGSPAAGGGGSTLTTDLVAYWKLDEASGTRNDSAGANHLSDSGTTASATGKISNGADFENSTPTHLSRSDNAALSLGADTAFAFALWIKVEAYSGFQDHIVSKAAANDGTGDEYKLYFNGLNQLTFVVGNGSSSASVSETTLGQPATATWYFVVIQHDPAANTISIQTGTGSTLGTAVTAAWSGGTQDTTAEFRLGAATSNDNLAFDGVIDEVYFRKGSTLSAGEVTQLFNGGAGLSHPF